jgi:hypothetical protein
MTNQTIFTSLRRFVLALALTAGCVAGDDVERRTESTGAPSSPGQDQPLPDPIDCAHACDRLFGGCGAEALGGAYADENECFEECDAGRLGDELDCILVTPCGAISRVCFGGPGDEPR